MINRDFPADSKHFAHKEIFITSTCPRKSACQINALVLCFIQNIHSAGLSSKLFARSRIIKICQSVVFPQGIDRSVVAGNLPILFQSAAGSASRTISGA